MRYPKRFSRAKRKRLKAQKGFSFTIKDMSNMLDYFESSEAKSHGWLVMGGNLVPKT